jgi:hypothetical protein
VSSTIDWPAIIKKEARGLNGEALGEVKEVSDTEVTIEKGLIDNSTLCIPKELVKDCDGHTLRFKITEEDAKNRFAKDKPNP